MHSYYMRIIALLLAAGWEKGECFSTSQSSSFSGPKSQERRGRRSGRTTQRPPSRDGPRTRRTTETDDVAFNPKELTAAQSSNENASPFSLSSVLTQTPPSLRCISDGDRLNCESTPLVAQPAFAFYSLDEVCSCPGLSALFNRDTEFRRALRTAMRQDVFDATPAYANLSEQAATVLLLPDSSLQGSWRTPGAPRMHRLTRVLRQGLGEEAPSGDELMQALGNLVGPEPSTHWIDIVGVLDRPISHSWHQDTGTARHQDTRTVLWGFPAEDNYSGCGVFSHVVALERECHAPTASSNGNESQDTVQHRVEPVLFDGKIEESFIIRPHYEPGREILTYRDIDVLHSSPDVAYRSNLMRFM